MNHKLFGRSWDIASRTNFFLATSNVGLVALVVIMGYSMATHHERVVVLPPHLDDKVEIGWRSANAPYFKSFGLYVASLIGNVTPQSAEFVADSVSAFTDRRIAKDVRNKILALAKDPQFTRSGGVNYYVAKRVDYEPETARVFAIGDIVTVSPISNRDTRRPVTYEMELRIVNGRPLIANMDSYDGYEPHTSKWQEANRVQMEREANSRLKENGQEGVQ